MPRTCSSPSARRRAPTRRASSWRASSPTRRFPELDEARGARDALWLALTDMTVGMARSHPLVVVIEDAQWADAESLAWVDHLLARAAGRPLSYLLAVARPALWRDDPTRFEGRDHVRIELRPLSRKQARAIASAILGERAQGEAGEALADSIAQQSAGLAAVRRGARAHRRRRAGRIGTRRPSRPRCRFTSTRSTTSAATPRRSLRSSGKSAGTAGSRRSALPGASEALRELAAAEVLVEQAHSRFGGTREFAFKHALMREVAYASLGEESSQGVPRPRRPMARESRRGRRASSRVTSSSEATGSRRPCYLEKAARRALAAHALGGGGVARRESARVRRRQADPVLARAAPRRGVEPPRRARRRARHRRARDEGRGPRRGERGARARRPRSLRGRLRRAIRRRARASTRCGARRKLAGLPDEEARCAAALAARYAYAGELDKAAEVADGLLTLSQRHNIAGAAVDAWQTLAVVTAGARRGGRGPRGAP